LLLLISLKFPVKILFPFIFFIAFGGVEGSLYAQDRVIDSLKLALKNSKHDTTKAQVLLAWGEQIYLQQPDRALVLWKKAIELAEQNLPELQKGDIEYKTFNYSLAASLNNIGFIYQNQGDIPKGLECYHKSLKLEEEIGNKQGVASSLNNIGAIYDNQGEFSKALEYYHKCLKLEEEIRLPDGQVGDKQGIANSLNNIGFIYQNQGNIPKALEYYNKSLKIREEIRLPDGQVVDKPGIASTLNNIGCMYQNQGNIPSALVYLHKSLKIREEMMDKQGIASSLNNIGCIYQNQGDIPKALEFHSKSLKIQEEIGDKHGIASSLNSIGTIYDNQGDPDVTSSKEDALRAGIPMALEYYHKSLKIREEIGDKQGVANSLINIGMIYQKQGDAKVTFYKPDALRASITIAFEFFHKSLKIMEEIGDKQGIALSLNNIGMIYFKQKNYLKAEENSKRSISISKELGFPENIRNAAERLNQIYKATGNYKLALENYELFILMRDSINNATTRKASIKQQLKHEYEKQAAADSVAHAKESEIKNVQLQKQNTEIKAKKNQQYALFGGLGLVMIFAGFMFNRFKVTQKQKVIIEHQKEVVEEQKKLVDEKQKEVMDSIRYAKRIQMAQIPSEKQVGKSLERLRKN